MRVAPGIMCHAAVSSFIVFVTLILGGTAAFSYNQRRMGVYFRRNDTWMAGLLFSENIYKSVPRPDKGFKQQGALCFQGSGFTLSSRPLLYSHKNKDATDS